MLPNFLSRWILSGLGLWVASGILGPNHLSVGHGFWTVVVAGFILAAVNLVLRPLLVFLSLPAILLSLGLFMVVVNGLMVLIASKLYHPLIVHGLWTAIWAGIIIGLVNFLITRLLEEV